MGTDTVGFVVVERKDFFKVTDCIVTALKKYSIVSPNIIVSPEIQYCRVTFDVKEKIDNISIWDMPTIERRNLSIHFNCDSDYSNITDGPKIIWALGHWGMSQEIIRDVCKAMVQFGKVYFIPMDTEDYFEIIETK